MCKFIIFYREQIKILNSSLFFAILSKNKTIHKTNTNTHIHFYYIFSFFLSFFFLHTTNYTNSKTKQKLH